MRLSNFLSTILFVVLLSPSLLAQSYPFFSVESAPYQPLQGGTALVNSAWDDPGFSVPVPFDFQFFSSDLEELILSDGFSIVSLAHDLTDQIPNLMIAYGADLVDRGYLDNVHLSPIRYQVTGETGSRVLTIEWENAGFLGDLFSLGTSTDYINFQIKLYEANGDIVYHFGPSVIEYPEFDFGDLPGPIIGIAEEYEIATDQVLGEIVLLDGNPINPDVKTEYDNFALTGLIPENTLYRFSREMASRVEGATAEDHGMYFPNPATNRIQLTPSFHCEDCRWVKMYDVHGSLKLASTQPNELQLASIMPGTYVIVLESQQSRYFQRLIVLPH